MFYGDKSVKEMDDYYQINTDQVEYPHWQHKDCEKIQRAFSNHAIMLTLAECKELYEDYSDRMFSSSWSYGIEESSEQYIFELLLPLLRDKLKDKVKRISVIVDELERNGYFRVIPADVSCTEKHIPYKGSNIMEIKNKLDNIIWHIENNRKILGDERTLDDVFKSLKNWSKELSKENECEVTYEE